MKNSFFTFIHELIGEFISGLPDGTTLLILLVAFTAWAYLCAKISAYLKTKKTLRTGYTRKTYHFLIFISAALINLALAREADHPNSTLYVIIPYFSTLSGGILINYFFPELVIIGYLICGVADASGEVIGTTFGKHTFKVRIFNIHKSVKSLEGSGSVFLVSFLLYTLYSIIAVQSLDIGLIAWIFLSAS